MRIVDSSSPNGLDLAIAATLGRSSSDRVYRICSKMGISLEEIGEELAASLKSSAGTRRLGKAFRYLDDAASMNVSQNSTPACWPDACIGCGCLSLEDADYANPGDRAARQGAGPRYWIPNQLRFAKCCLCKS